MDPIVYAGEDVHDAVIPDDAAATVSARNTMAEGLQALPVAPAQQNDAIQQEQGDVEMANDDDDEQQAPEEEEEAGDAMADLFGDDEDDEEQQQQQQEQAQDTAAQAGESAIEQDVDETGEGGLSAAELERRRRLEYEEGDDDEAAVVEQKVQYAQIKLAKLPMASELHKQWHAKLPNFIHLESQPFNTSTYDPKEEPSTIPPENVIRWRWDQSSPTPKKQSNARFIRWSDGSLSLQLGKEIFDVSTDRTVSGKAVPGAANPTSAIPSTSASRNADSLTYLVAQHPYAGLLESQAPVQGSMSFRPTAIQSASHRRLAAKAAGLTQAKPNKVVMMMAEKDPEAEKLAREQALRGPKKARAPKGEGAGAGGRKKRKSVRSTRLDDFSDGEFGSDDAGDGGEEGESAALAAARRKQRQQQDKDEMNDFLASDSDDASSGDERGAARSSRTRREEMEAGSDDLDDLEAQAERAARRARGSKKKSGAGAGGQRVREASVGSEDLDKDEAFTKKKLIVESDDDE